MESILENIVDEGARVVMAAQANGINIRLLGGVGVYLQCPEAMTRSELTRVYKDLDLVAPKRSSKAIGDLIVAHGYVADRRFNALHGATRLLYYDGDYGRQVDVFLGVFEMCHAIDLEPRLSMPGLVLPPSDLLLLKLQIVELNEKDLTDALALFVQYDLADEDGPSTLSRTYIAALCSRDWGWYTTLRDNLLTVHTSAPQMLRRSDDAQLVQQRVEGLLAAMDSAPKTVGWRLRDKVGRRKVWYELPEEVRR